MVASLLEQELDELYILATDGEKEGKSVANFRRYLAYALKAIAAGASIFIATGLCPSAHQMVGIAVLIAVFVDTVSSNHKRLIASVEAGYAFRSLRHRVKREFNREVSPLYQKAKNGDRSVEPKIERLMKAAHIALSDGIEEICKLKEASDVEALKSLSLDQERAGFA